MSDLDEMDYHLSEDDRSDEDDDEHLEQLYNDAKAEFKAVALSHRFDDLFALESAMQRKTIWGFKAAKRLLKTAIEQPDVEGISAHYRQLLSYAYAVTTNDFEKCMLKTVNRLASASQTEALRALFSISIAEGNFTTASARTAVRVAQSLVQMQPNESTLGCLVDLQHRLESTNDVSSMTKNRCLLELYALLMELFWCMEKFENMSSVYGKALSLEDTVLGSQHMSSAHGFYGRYLLRCNKADDALDYLAKAVEGYEATSDANEQQIACVQSLALAAYTSATANSDNLLEVYSRRRDVVAIRRFAMAFLTADVAELERTFHENEDTFKDCKIWRLLRHYETVLKRKLCLRTSPLPADCWADVLQCLTHPTWHHLQTVCRKLVPVLTPLLHHLQSNVQKARFEHVPYHWEISLHSKSRRVDKLVYYHRVLDDELLASAVMQGIVAVKINNANSVTDDGMVRFCFDADGRRLEIHRPMQL